MTSTQIAQIGAAAIIMLFLCIGSFRSAGACCILAWIIGGIMIFLGWWVTSIPEFALAGFLSILIAIDEGKQSVREA
jgi:TM2 domain-containing membrane protein YozV